MTQDKIKVLFVCVYNSARSQMAEEFLKKYGKDKFEVESAGLEPRELNPVVVEVMKEIHIDISNNRTKSVFEYFKQGKRYHYVITVCDETKAEKCPIFPGTLQNLHWGFEDPASFTGNMEEKLIKTRKVRDEIEIKTKKFIDSIINM